MIGTLRPEHMESVCFWGFVCYSFPFWGIYKMHPRFSKGPEWDGRILSSLKVARQIWVITYQASIKNSIVTESLKIIILYLPMDEIWWGWLILFLVVDLIDSIWMNAELTLAHKNNYSHTKSGYQKRDTIINSLKCWFLHVWVSRSFRAKNHMARIFSSQETLPTGSSSSNLQASFAAQDVEIGTEAFRVACAAKDGLCSRRSIEWNHEPRFESCEWFSKGFYIYIYKPKNVCVCVSVCVGFIL